MRDVVEFDPNVPQRIALQYSAGKIVEGRNGQRVMYSLADGRVMFLDLGVAEQINRLKPRPGEALTVCLAKSKGRAAEWIVEREPRDGEQPDGTYALPKEMAAAGVEAPATAHAAVSQPHDSAVNAHHVSRPDGKLPMNIAVLEAVQMVRDAMRTAGEQWSDVARQDLVSTILIGAQKEGWVCMWERPAAAAPKGVSRAA